MCLKLRERAYLRTIKTIKEWQSGKKNLVITQGRIVRRDEEPFKKAFNGTAHLLIKYAGKPSVIRLIGYIMLNLKKNDMEIHLSIPVVQAAIGYKNRSEIYEGIKILKSEKFLDYVGTNLYVINPDFLWNGKRTRLTDVETELNEKEKAIQDAQDKAYEEYLRQRDNEDNNEKTDNNEIH
jgi:hypothetical protein